MADLEIGQVGNPVSQRILVTGGAGFLGAHLCRKLVHAGHDVLCVDNYLTGRRSNLEDIGSVANFEMMRHDVIAPLNVEVDAIFNLACPASPIHYQRDPIQTAITCVQGAINLLDLAKRTGARIFQASTSEVYGDPEVHPQIENYWGHVNPIGTRSCYDEGKRCAETLFFDYWRTMDVEIKVARVFNTYGPGMHPDDGRVVSNFVMQALQGRPLTVFGDGSQTRCFCYVDDMIEGFLRFMESPPTVVGPINLGNPVEHSMTELAETILEMTGSESKIEFHSLPEDDPKKRMPDITRAREVLGWEPKTELRRGLEPTIAYFRGLIEKGFV